MSILLRSQKNILYLVHAIYFDIDLNYFHRSLFFNATIQVLREFGHFSSFIYLLWLLYLVSNLPDYFFKLFLRWTNCKFFHFHINFTDAPQVFHPLHLHYYPNPLYIIEWFSNSVPKFPFSKSIFKSKNTPVSTG